MFDKCSVQENPNVTVLDMAINCPGCFTMTHSVKYSIITSTVTQHGLYPTTAINGSTVPAGNLNHTNNTHTVNSLTQYTSDMGFCSDSEDRENRPY